MRLRSEWTNTKYSSGKTNKLENLKAIHKVNIATFVQSYG